ncbi:hypothetical protein JI667_11605 [Bacillus sp. NTK074B]|uniref:hypothetical protein n=1 Tax=Bacillus sp. NTK074B TaxID=2802174 RepID=UPI001A900371|nr:hypothetical protein [Bacillus sp. NTK074B]
MMGEVLEAEVLKEALRKRDGPPKFFGGPSLFHVVWNVGEVGKEEEFQLLKLNGISVIEGKVRPSKISFILFAKKFFY